MISNQIVSSKKKLIFIIILQAVLLIALFWVLVFYAKDELEAYQTQASEEIESPERVNNNEGIATINLPLDAQLNSGIRTAPIVPAKHQDKIESFGHVIAIDSLIEAQSRYLNIQSQIRSARAASSTNLAQYKRLETLNADDKNVSDLLVQQALGLVNADKANITAAEMQLKNMRGIIELQWGETLASLVASDKTPVHLSNLLKRKNVLVQVSLPFEQAAPAVRSTIKIYSHNQTDQSVLAHYISPAVNTDTSGYGKTFYYSAPAQSLRIGMRVNVELNQLDKGNSNGIIIPNDAVVWYGGKPWAYFKNGKSKNGNDQFVRKPISTNTEVAHGWFNQDLNAGESETNEVVINGAQLLLSEEFKYLIKNENED